MGAISAILIIAIFLIIIYFFCCRKKKNAAVLESDVSRERNFQQSKSTHHRHISEHQDSTLAPEKNESSRGLQEAQTSTGVDLGEGSNFQRSSLAPANSTYLTPTMTRGRSLHLDPS